MTRNSMVGLSPERADALFLRPVDDSKEEPGRVRHVSEILKLAASVLSLDEDETPGDRCAIARN